MESCCHLAADNVGYLQQAIDLLEGLDDARYTRISPATYRSAIGGHIRHCADHYASFLAGASRGRIDYDARPRDPRVEQDRHFARGRLRELSAALQQFGNQPDAPVLVKMDCGDATDPDSWWCGSTIRRELQFLLSHTVHHFALIGFILKSDGFDPGPDFGIAPSTLRHNASQTPCAQ